VKRTSVAHLNCSVAQALDIVGEWWTLLVLRNIMLGQRRFEALQADLGIARNILSDRLSTLVAHGVVEKAQYSDNPPRFEYRLTQRGADLFPVIVSLMRWGDTWAAPDGPPLLLRHECGSVEPPLLVCADCRKPIELGNVRAKAGPGYRPRVEPNPAKR
jgi:DNA-binding HxlR family transcriptional regulator